jgi:hypothetical protein
MGFPADTFTLRAAYEYPRTAIWDSLSPSVQWRTSADGSAANIVLDAGANNKWCVDMVALFGTNYRTATLELNTADSWGAPAQSISLDATIASFTVGSASFKGKGFVGPTTSLTWRPAQFKSDGDAHRIFLALDNGSGVVVYEVADNDTDRIFVDGVDFSSATGTAYLFGDKAATKTTPTYQYRYARLSIGSQETADNEYRTGLILLNRRWEPAIDYEVGFSDTTEANTELFEAESGHRAATRLGPRRFRMSLPWGPLNYPTHDVEGRLRDLYAALDGGRTPFALWRDTSDQTTLGLYRFKGGLKVTNVYGDGTPSSSYARVDVEIEEEF